MMFLLRILSLFVVLMAHWTTDAFANPETLRKATVALQHWKVEEARRLLEPLLPSDDLGVTALLAEILFNEGEYASAAAVMEVIPQNVWPAVDALRSEIENTRQALAGYEEELSPNGRFKARFKSRDRLLLPALFDVLERQDQALQEDFGFRPEGTVLIEIYPRHEVLAQVTTLTEEDLETSGTIALCKYNKLMITSPGGLARGYGWRDTVAHEFVHYYVSKITGETVPIWLHEGIAKLEENRWRHTPNEPLEPQEENAIAHALKDQKFVTFEEMHPSMAKLPSQGAASLAYAEVHSVLKVLFEKHGYEGLNALLRSLDQGTSLDLALHSTYGYDLAGLWRFWKNAAPTLGYKIWPDLKPLSLKFSKPGDPVDPLEDDYATIEEKNTKDLAHLGELLRAQNRHLAALRHYQKAMEISGKGNPTVQNGAASALLALQRPAEVEALLETVLKCYPTFLTSWLNLGRAKSALGQNEAAIAAYEEALAINPFHPEIYDALEVLYTRENNQEKANFARKAKEILR